PVRANASVWELVDDAITEISGFRAAAQQVMLAVPPQQWLAQSDTSRSLAGTDARAISRRTVLAWLDLGSPATRLVAMCSVGMRSVVMCWAAAGTAAGSIAAPWWEWPACALASAGASKATHNTTAATICRSCRLMV